MSVELITILMMGSLIGLMMTGRQIFVVIGAVGTIAALALWGKGGYAMPYSGGYTFTTYTSMIAIPPFIFMGMILSKSGVAGHLYQSLYLIMGRVRGSLAMGTVGLCALIAAMSGTSSACTITAGTISLPEMLKRGYDKTLALGVVMGGGALGFLIPPSVLLIIYGMIAQASVGHLWLAGIIPGLLLAVLFISYIAIRCRINPKMGPALPPEERVGWGEKFRSLRFGILPILVILAVLGLLFMGVTSLIETASIGVAGALILAASQRRLTWQMIKEVSRDSFRVTCMILWLCGASFLFGAVFDGLGAVHAVGNLLGIAGDSPMTIIAMMMLSFFFMGMVLGDVVMLLIVAPLYIPLVSSLGFSLVWFGILYTMNVEMAYLTPPFGIILFYMKGIVTKESGITIGDIYKAIIPIVGLQALGLILVMFFPQIALWLPGVVMGGG